MPINPHITQKFWNAVSKWSPDATARAPLAALALLCITVLMTPQAAAQACGPSLTLTANQWTMVGIPCVPPTGRKTIGDVFGPSLGTANYGVTWIAWKRVYNDNQCVVSSGPSDCYIKLTLASAANTGDAFWIYTTERKTWQPGSTTGSTPGPNVDFPARLSPDGNSRYYMFANPYSGRVNWSNLVFPTLWFGFIPVSLSTEQAITYTFVSKNVHYWNGNTYYTRDLSSPQATFTAKHAAWLEMLKPTPANWWPSATTIRVPAP